MPIYEFCCPACEARFEALVAAGTEVEECRECGAAGATRVMSTPAATPRLVKSGGANRRQEDKNRRLHEKTKSDFKAKRAQARRSAKARQGGS
jgi:putative FmdB family regulatory protein